MKRDIHDLRVWASFKLTHYATRHLIRAKNVSAYVVKGHLRSLVRFSADGREMREIPFAEKLALPYREILFWSDTEEVVSSKLA